MEYDGAGGDDLYPVSGAPPLLLPLQEGQLIYSSGHSPSPNLFNCLF